MWHKIRYSHFPQEATPAFPAGRDCARPVLKVTLANGARHLTCYALVDSGADNCFFPLSFASAIGLNPAVGAPDTASGLGGDDVNTYYCTLRIHLDGIAEYDLNVGFTDGLERLGMGLLGECGFFDRFNVAFNRREGFFYVETDSHPG